MAQNLINIRKNYFYILLITERFGDRMWMVVTTFLIQEWCDHAGISSLLSGMFISWVIYQKNGSKNCQKMGRKIGRKIGQKKGQKMGQKYRSKNDRKIGSKPMNIPSPKTHLHLLPNTSNPIRLPNAIFRIQTRQI